MGSLNAPQVINNVPDQISERKITVFTKNTQILGAFFLHISAFFTDFKKIYAIVPV